MVCMGSLLLSSQCTTGICVHVSTCWQWVIHRRVAIGVCAEVQWTLLMSHDLADGQLLRSTGSNKSGHFGRVGLHQLKVISDEDLLVPNEDLRGRNVLIYLTLCYVRCSTSSLFAISFSWRRPTWPKRPELLTLCYVRCSTSSLFAISHAVMSLYSISISIVSFSWRRPTWPKRPDLFDPVLRSLLNKFPICCQSRSNEPLQHYTQLYNYVGTHFRSWCEIYNL